MMNVVISIDHRPRVDATHMEVEMWILVRLALTCGLGCMVARECGYDLPIPGHGNPFVETALFVLISVIIGELAQVVKEWIIPIGELAQVVKEWIFPKRP